MFASLGRWCYRHRRIVVGLWLAALLGAGALSGAVGSGFRSDFSGPDSESKDGQALVAAHYGGFGGTSGRIVFQADAGVTDPSVQGPMTELFDQVAELPDVKVTSPYSPEGASQIAREGELAGKVAYATVDVPDDISQNDATELTDSITALLPDLPGVQIELGGQVFAEFEPPSSELIGLAFAIVILIFAFGSVMAMGLPIGMALAGIGVGVSLVTLLSNVVTMPDFATQLSVMIGLGVGIDYALFIVTRHREGLHQGRSMEASVVTAMDTAGRAVVFAGCTVVISLLGMLIMGVSFVNGLGIGAAVTVSITVLASITLLPALLGFVGDRLEVSRWRGLLMAGLVAIGLVGAGLSVQPLLVGLPLALVVLVASFVFAPLRKPVPRREPKPRQQSAWYRWSRLVQRRPWTSAIVGAGVLVLLAIPVLSLRLGFSDEGNYPEGSTTRSAYDLLAAGFGPGSNGPLFLVAELPAGTSPESLAGVTSSLQATEGVAFVAGPIPSQDGQAVAWNVVPTTAPQDEATTDLVRHLRSDVLPGAPVDVKVTGFVAAQVDFSDYLAARLPWFFGVVLSLSFLLLMAVFRSLLVPLKAVIMNLLSIGAAYGLVVMIFQWGWLGDITGLGGGPIEPFVPMMMFAIVFGLSMDYEVFLLSRIREEYDRTGDAVESVADGLTATAHVITAAAAIMVVVFGSFFLESQRVLKLFGLGLSSAVLLDATIVRMLLVPATMELLGERNWWLPAWLDRILPRLNVEGSAGHDDDEPTAEPEPEVLVAR